MRGTFQTMKDVSSRPTASGASHSVSSRPHSSDQLHRRQIRSATRRPSSTTHIYTRKTPLSIRYRLNVWFICTDL